MHVRIFTVTALTFGLLALPGCGAPVLHDPGHAAFAPATAPLPGLLDDIGSLHQADNDARRDALVTLLERAGFSPRFHEFPNDGRPGGDTRPAGRNVIVSVGDGEPAIVAGAHFDAVFLRDGTFASGMVDNAASVVALARAAETLRDAPLARRIDFVFFDMEEIGLVGSRHYAASLDADSVKAMVNLDINAYGDTVFYGQAGHGHTELYDALARTCAAQSRACVDFDRYPSSDHLSFERAGIPNVSMSVLPRAEVHQLWLLMHEGEGSGLTDGFTPGVFRTIHSDGDTLERVDVAAVTLAYNVLVALLEELSR